VGPNSKGSTQGVNVNPEGHVPAGASACVFGAALQWFTDDIPTDDILPSGQLLQKVKPKEAPSIPYVF